MDDDAIEEYGLLGDTDAQLTQAADQTRAAAVRCNVAAARIDNSLARMEAINQAIEAGVPFDGDAFVTQTDLVELDESPKLKREEKVRGKLIEFLDTLFGNRFFVKLV